MSAKVAIVINLISNDTYAIPLKIENKLADDIFGKGFLWIHVGTATLHKNFT